MRKLTKLTDAENDNRPHSHAVLSPVLAMSASRRVDALRSVAISSSENSTPNSSSNASTTYMWLSESHSWSELRELSRLKDSIGTFNIDESTANNRSSADAFRMNLVL